LTVQAAGGIGIGRSGIYGLVMKERKALPANAEKRRRQERLARALRANLKRRKAASTQPGDDAPPPDAVADGTLGGGRKPPPGEGH
jgi:hypothetical protein